MLELIASTCLIINVYLAAREKMINFLFGAVGVLLYFFIFYQAKLYADMMLQLVFFSLQFHGAYHWYFKKGTAQTPVVSLLNRAGIGEMIQLSVATMLLFCVLAYILKNYTDSTTVMIDALTTAMSLTAQWMLNRKILETWIVWIVIDVISIEMYAIKSLHITTVLMFIYLGLAILGYSRWRKDHKFQIQSINEA